MNIMLRLFFFFFFWRMFLILHVSAAGIRELHVYRSMSLPGGVPNGDLPSAFGRKRPREDDGKHTWVKCIVVYHSFFLFFRQWQWARGQCPSVGAGMEGEILQQQVWSSQRWWWVHPQPGRAVHPWTLLGTGILLPGTIYMYIHCTYTYGRNGALVCSLIYQQF